MKHPNRLKVLRAERRVTQLDLALKAGISNNRYWRIENGYEQPTDRERAQLARILKTEQADLGFPFSETEATA